MENNLSSDQLKRIKKRSVWFNGSCKLPVYFDSIKNNIKEFNYYAYIMHKPDEDDDKLHIHFLLRCNGTRSIKNVADTLGCPYQNVQDTNRPRSYARYLIHLDNPEKEQYSIEDVVTSDVEYLKSFLTDNNLLSAKNLFNDLELVKTGRLSQVEFVEKYSYHIDKLPFYQKIKTMEVISRLKVF